MKAVLDDACRKCGSTIWYVHRSGRRCVPCAHNRALTGRALIRQLEARVAELDALLAAERESMKRNGWRQCAVGQRITQFCGAAEVAVQAEREACAKTVERARLQLDGRHGITNETDFIATQIVDFLAAQIRERKA